MLKFLASPLSALAATALLLGACAPARAVSTPPAAPLETIVSLTFDDGDADNFAIARDLTSHGLSATWYVPSSLVGTDGYMTWDQLALLKADGHDIGGHTRDHVRVDGLTAQELRQQICEDRAALEAHGLEPVSFAYPYGGYDDTVKRIVGECGYAAARVIGAGPELIPPPDPYTLRAYPYIVYDTTFSKLQRYVSGTRKEGGGWLILIFHHVCDDCDYFSVKPDVMQRFIAWLAEEQAQGRIKVRTVRDIILQGAP